MAGLILTHPHQDHAPGLDRLAEDHPGAWVGCAPGWVQDWADTDLMDAEAVQREGTSQHTLAAIHRTWKSTERQWLLTRDSTRQVGDAVFTALHPGKSEADAFRRRPRINPNLLSSAMLLEWGECRILLGADLPASRWKRNLGRRGLGQHNACKVPHHGSKDSVSPVYAEGDSQRLWFTTPWNRSSGLPRFEDGEGLQYLLGFCDKIWLTALPYEINLESQTVVRQSIKPSPLPAFPGARASHPLRSSQVPCTGWLLYSFDSSGALIHQEFGSLACSIVEG